MKRLVVGIIAAAVLVSMARTAMAQTKTVTSEMRTETATVEAIEAATRTVTLKKPDGTYVTTVAGPDIKRFEEIKVGDKVNARYYENVVVRLKQPGEPDVDSRGNGHDRFRTGPAWRHQGQAADDHGHDHGHRPGRAPSITFTGPNGWKYTSKVQDTEALAKVKVGDKVDIVWTEAVLVSVERGKLGPCIHGRGGPP